MFSRMRVPLLTALPVFGALSLFAQTTNSVGRAIFRNNVIPYQVVNGRAVFDGDIELGPAAQMSDAIGPVAKGGEAQSAYATNPQVRWPGGFNPYAIDPDIPDAQRILDAIEAWQSTTPIRMTPRGSEGNYVHFVR